MALAGVVELCLMHLGVRVRTINRPNAFSYEGVGTVNNCSVAGVKDKSRHRCVTWGVPSEEVPAPSIVRQHHRLPDSELA